MGARAMIDCICCGRCGKWATATGGGICEACAIRETHAAELTRLQAELAAAREQRDALAAHVERLVVVLQKIRLVCDDAMHGEPMELAIAALAATPAQSLAAHDAAVKAAVLREVANLIRNTTPEPIEKVWSTHGSHEGRILAVDQILSEADRIEKEAPHA